VDLTGGFGRQKYGKEFLGPLKAPPPFTYFAGGAVVNYTFDTAGGIARSIEERRALFEYQRQELRAAHLALCGNVVSQAIALASAAERIRAINELSRRTAQPAPGADLLRRRQYHARRCAARRQPACE
jgi:outer membrane protein TolC